MEERSDVELSIVVPVYNEEQVFEKLLERLVNSAQAIGVSYEIIFVNDGSRDNTLQKVRAASEANDHVHFISFTRNFGHQVAVSAGMEHASGNAIVTIDGDLQDPPELIAQMYQEYLNGNKVVYAKRMKRKEEPVFKKTATYIFYRMLSKMVSFDIPLDVGDFRLISKDVLDYLMEMDEYDKYLRGQIAWMGFKSTYVMYDRDGRKYGKSNYPFKKLLGLAFNGITSFSDAPLKMAAKMGFFVCFMSLLIALYALYSYYIKKVSPPGWASLIITVTFLGGVQLLFLGVLGEYISRIIHNVRKRPLYIIDQTTLRKKPKKEKEDRLA